MQQPKKSKYRKEFRGKMRGVKTVGSTLAFGQYGLKAIGRGWLTNRQLEAARKVISRSTKRQGKVWIRVFTNKPYTKKAAGAKMGSGKGDIEGYVFVVLPGRIIFELAGVTVDEAREAVRKAGHKLPFKTVFTQR